MKRTGKCVGKQTFSHRREAEAKIIHNFATGRKAFGIYECPTCLDFHLTSKYDNRSDKLKKKCKEAKNKYRSILPEKRYKFLDKFCKKYINQGKPKKPKVLQPPNPKSKTQIAKQKALEYKKSILPRSEVKKITNNLNKPKLSLIQKIKNYIKDLL
jgi:hypothetical protein